MRVVTTQRTSTGATARRPAQAGAPFGFATAGAQTAQPRAQVQASATVTSLEAIMALQVAGEEGGRKRALKRGAALLDDLDRLKLGLLSGHIGPADLARLKTTLARHGEVDDDPELAELLKAIDLRARVEVAKLEQRLT